MEHDDEVVYQFLQSTLLKTKERILHHQTDLNDASKSHYTPPDDIERVLMNHWSRLVPIIYRPQAGLPPEYDETLASEHLMQPLDWYLTGVENASEFWKQIRAQAPPSQMCGKVFKGGEPCYCCRDCGTDNTCVLCVDCFLNGQHRYHRYRICHSNSGYCDCGDKEAWKEHHCCSNHSADNTSLDEAQNRLKTFFGDANNLAAFETRLIRIIELVTDYSYALLKWTHTELPAELVMAELSIPDNVRENLDDTSPGGPYAAVLYNDETHTYEHVIHSLVKTIRCDSKQATDFASTVDREGRCIIMLDSQARCQQVSDAIADHTRKHSEKRLVVEVQHTAVFAHQLFADKLLAWIGELLEVYPTFRSFFHQHIFKTPHNINCITITKKDDPLTNVDDEMRSLAEKIMLSDTKLWKAIRIHLHQLLMNAVFFDLKAKQTFATLYTLNYERMLLDYMEDDHEHRVSVLSLSVQLFTVPSIVQELLEKNNALARLVQCFIDITKPYWNNDLQRFRFDHPLSHYPLKRSFQLLNDIDYLLDKVPTMWTNALRESFCNGADEFSRLLKLVTMMDAVVRQTQQHIEYEPGWEMGITLQTKIAPIMTNIVLWAITDERVYFRTLANALKHLLSKLVSLHIDNSKQIVERAFEYEPVICYDFGVSRQEMSIHFPLIRLITGLLLHSSRFAFRYLENGPHWPQDILPNGAPSLMALAEMPLRLQVMVAQNRAGMWRRNGYSLVNQIMFYQNVRLREEMYDRDIQMLQISAAFTEPNTLLIRWLNKFKLMILLTPSDRQRPNTDEEIKHTTSLIEEYLRLLYTVLVERHQVGLGKGITTPDYYRHEVIQWLCRDSMANSELIVRLTTTSEFEGSINTEEVINSVANFRAPTNSTTTTTSNRPGGKYYLKEEFYEQFNPLFYHYRRNDQSVALDNQLRRLKKQNAKYVCCPPPPLPDFVDHFAGINSILTADAFLQVIQNILNNTRNLSETLYNDSHFQLCLYLLAVGLNEEAKDLNGPVQFTKAAKKFGIFDQLLYIRRTKHILPRVHSHMHLFCWVLDRWRDLVDRQKELHPQNQEEMLIDDDEPLTLDQMALRDEANRNDSDIDDVEPEVNRKEEELKKIRKTAAEERRKKIMAQFEQAQKQFVKDNAQMFEQTKKHNVKDIESDGGAESSSTTLSMSSSSGSMMDIASSDNIATAQQQVIFPATGTMPQNTGIAFGSNQDVGARVITTPSAAASAANGESNEIDYFTCIFCLENQNLSLNASNKEAFLVLPGYYQKSVVLSQNRSLRDGVFCETPSLFPVIPKPDNLCFVSADLFTGLHLSTCTHYMHFHCYQKHMDMLISADRRRNNRQLKGSFDVNRGEFLCPLCETLCNVVIPVFPRAIIEANSLKNDLPMDMLLSGIYSILSDIGCDGYSGYVDYKRYFSQFKGSNCSYPEMIHFLPPDIKSYFTNLGNEYNVNTQTNQYQLFNDQHTVQRRRSVVNDLMNAAFKQMYGMQIPVETESGDTFQSLYSSIAFTTQAFERLMRADMTNWHELVDSRQYHCLRTVISLCRTLFSTHNGCLEMKRLFLYLMKYLLVMPFHTGSPYPILEVDAFSILVMLVCTMPAFFGPDKPSSPYKFVTILGGSADKCLVELILTFHLVQIILTNNGAMLYSLDPKDAALFKSDQEFTGKSKIGSDQSLLSFCIDLLTSAGYVFDQEKLKLNSAQITKSIRFKLLPFLRCAALFAHFITDINLPTGLVEPFRSTATATDITEISNEEDDRPFKLYRKLPPMEEYDLLVRYLGLSETFHFLNIQYLRGIALSWPRHQSISFMVTHDKQCPLVGVHTALLPAYEFTRQPHPLNQLHQLPYDFMDLINPLSRFSCPSVSAAMSGSSDFAESRYPTMCLVCGKVLCSQNYCCQRKLGPGKDTQVGACTYHAMRCGAGTGLFIRVRDSKILFIGTYGRGSYVYPSPYVDKYGEPDHGLLRGGPLHLSKTNMRNLYKTWLRHGIPERITHLLEQHSALNNTLWNMM